MAVTLAAWDAAKGAPALALSRSAAEAAPNGAR
jgi:hypothetical protein